MHQSLQKVSRGPAVSPVNSGTLYWRERRRQPITRLARNSARNRQNRTCPSRRHGGDSTESKQRDDQCDDHEKGSISQQKGYLLPVRLEYKLQDRKRVVCTLAHIRAHE